jgi:Rad3-related DNA helicase
MTKTKLQIGNESSILGCAPAGFILRPEQQKALLDIESIWNKMDVLVLEAWVGSGKSVLGQTITKWCNKYRLSVATITPQVFLQDQYKRSFPDVVNLKGATRYQCGEHKGLNCRAVKDAMEKCCQGCDYTKAVSSVETTSNIICNFHSYIQHSSYKDVLIIDEGHNTFKFLQDFLTVIFWKDKHKFPDQTPDYGELALWIEKLIKDTKRAVVKASKDATKAKQILDASKDPQTKQMAIDAIADAAKRLHEAKSDNFRFSLALKTMITCPEPMFVERLTLERRGKQVECIRMRPKTMTGLPKILWPESKVSKIILMSGTIKELDTEKLGLSDKRVKTLKVPNVIPPENREIIPITNCNLSYAYQDKNLDKLAQTIKTIMADHPNSKGVIHTTYSLAAKLWKILDTPRVLYHSSDDKDARLREFLETKEPRVLMACGMSEGLDLAGSDYSWQIITKIMWPNRSDKMIEHFYQKEPEYISWETVRTTIQQTGRICRGPTDTGKTYIVDSSFGNPLTKQRGLFQSAYKFFDEDFKAAINWEKGLSLAKRIQGG